MFREDSLEQKAGEKGSRAQQQAKQVFFEAEFHSLQGLATILDHGELNDDGSHHNDQEKFVVEEILEDIVFVRLEFTSIDFIEDL